MLGIKYYFICSACGESTTKKANGDRGKAFMEAVKDGWKTGLNGEHYCPKCADTSQLIAPGVSDVQEPEPAPAPEEKEQESLAPAPVKAKEEKKPAPPEPEPEPEAGADDDF